MARYYDFLKECGIFYLATINGNAPAVRPFGAVMENDGDLFITAADTKAVYRQMKQNSNIQIVALKHGTREWIRINGNAEECADLAMKQKMLDACLILSKHYSAPTDAHFCIFRVRVTEVYITTDEGKEILA